MYGYAYRYSARAGKLSFNPASLPNTFFYSDPTIQSSVNTKVAADFVAANSEYLSTASTDFDSPTDFSFGAWVNFDLAAGSTVMGKYGLAGERSYSIYKNGSNVFQMYVSNDGTATNSVSWGSASSSGTWYFVACVHDSVNDLIKISVDGGAFVTAAHSTGVYGSSTADFRLGADYFGYFDGQQDAPFFYDKVLTISEVGTLYNSGNGQSYADMDKVSLVSQWPLNELSGNRSDSHGTNTLTDNATVGSAIGKVGEEVVAGNSVYTLGDLAPTSNDGTQTTLINEPIWNTTHITYATNDFVNIDAVLTDVVTSTNGTISLWYKPLDGTPLAGNYLISFGDTNASAWITVYLDTSGKIGFYCRKAGVAQWSVLTDAAAVTTGVWTHISVTQDGTPKIYIDNVLVAQTTSAVVLLTAWFNDIPLLDNGRIGCLNKDSSGDAFFTDGDIQQVYISTDVKDAATRTQLYENNQP